MSTTLDTSRGQRRSSRTDAKVRVPPSLGRERFRFTLRREQRRLPTLNIDPFVEHANWARDDQIKTGEINFRRPLTDLQAASIAKGDRVRCEVDLLGTGNWRPLWHMTVNTPSQQIASGIMSMALASGLKAAQESKASWKFKNRTARQITLEVAERFGIPVGPLPAARHSIGKLIRKSASPADVITAAWREEREATGRRFDLDLSRGRIDVRELVAPKRSLILEHAIIDATVTQSLDRMASAVVVTSTRKRNGRKTKLTVKVVDADRVRRYGYIVRQVNEPGLQTVAACRRFGKRWLARNAKPTGDITFSHMGIAFLDRGDPILLTLKDADIVRLPCWVKSTTHEVSAGSYTMDVTVSLTDPWVDVRKERAKKKRENAAIRRRRNRRGTSTPPTPKKRNRRT